MLNQKAYNKKISTTKLTYSGMLVALSAVGAMIKYPGTSIALDSMTGFFASLFLGPAYGAIVAALGHLLTATTSGFPLTIPMHLVITLEMAVTAYVFGKLYKKGFRIISNIVAIILNGPVSASIASALAIPLGLPLYGFGLFSVIIIPLTLASIINIVFATLLYEIILKNRR